MLTRSACGILLKLIYYLEKKKRTSINGKELLKLIYLMQNQNPSIFIFNIHKPLDDETPEELISIDYWNDLNILENSGRIKIHQSEPLINITFMGSLSADTIQIPEDIEKCFINTIITF